MLSYPFYKLFSIGQPWVEHWYWRYSS